MRTTLTLDEDLAARLKADAHERDIPFKQAVNEAIRNGLDGSPTRKPIELPTFDMGEPLVDLTKAGQVAAALDDQEFLRKMREQE